MDVGKRRHTKNWSMVILEEEAAPVVTETTLRATDPLTGGLSAVNAVGTQLRDLMGPTRWRLTIKRLYVDAVAESGKNPASNHQIQPECGQNERADAGWEGRTCLATSNSQARTGTGKNIFPFSSDHEQQNWQPYSVDPNSAINDDHTYIHSTKCILPSTNALALSQMDNRTSLRS